MQFKIGNLMPPKATNTTIGVIKGGDDIQLNANGEPIIDTNYDDVEKNIDTNLANISKGSNFKTILGNIKVALIGLHELCVALGKNKLDKSHLINNGLTTEEGFALDARYGKTLADGIAQTNSKWNSLGTYPMKYLGEDIQDVNLIPDGCTWCITGSSTANKPLGWTAARIIIVSFMISDYRLQFAGNQSTGKFAVRISPGGWVEK